jgi:hypothetical protein
MGGDDFNPVKLGAGEPPKAPKPDEDAKGYEEVDHPQHYGGDTVYEVKKVIRAWGLPFPLDFAVKHIARAGKKPGNSALKDLKKALWYIQDEIRHIETGEL